MAEVFSKQIKQNQTPRLYFEINGFEFRVGEFYDPNRHFNGPKMELRVLKQIDDDLLDGGIESFNALVEKVKEWVS
jgi:hypothetical protein